jgi:ribosomal protein S18 acetylase RimI-like enzyme
MIYDLTEQAQIEGNLPEGFESKSLEDAKEDELYSCYYAAFLADDSQLFLEQSETERREFFDTLGFAQACNEPGSSMVLKDDQTVGFTYVVPYGETNCHISCMCVHPNCQRQGLGSFMLYFAKREAASQGYKTITIWTEPDMGAFQLYCKNGFKTMGDVTN